jgi:hypothetical protein
MDLAASPTSLSENRSAVGGGAKFLGSLNYSKGLMPPERRLTLRLLDASVL